LLIVLIFLINITFILAISKISNQKTENLLVITSLFVNIAVIAFYFYLNYRFISDFENIVDSIKKTFDHSNECSIKNESFFIENKKLESLFKKIYIKNNLARKDLSDLKEVFGKFIPNDIFKDI